MRYVILLILIIIILCQVPIIRNFLLVAFSIFVLYKVFVFIKYILPREIIEKIIFWFKSLGRFIVKVLLKISFLYRFFIKVEDIVSEVQEYIRKIYYLNSYEQYLIAKDKDILLDERERLQNKCEAMNLSLMKPYDQERVKNLINILIKIKEFITTYNDIFIRRRIKEYQSLIVKQKLNEEQQMAVFRDDIHNLIIAGAGSGKTRVLLSRIAYLTTRKDKVLPSRILAISYTRNAAEVMAERLKKDFNVSVDTMTFHKFGLQILSEEYQKKIEPYDPQENNFVANNMQKVLENSEVKKYYYQFLTHFYDDDLEATDFQTKEQYVNYLKSKKYQTLKGEEVKSKAEKAIADFLFLNRVEYKYESVALWATEVNLKTKQLGDKENYRVYRPDFYLPQYDIYIEHWGVNRKGEVAAWFSMSPERYQAKMNWARKIFKKAKKRLVESYEYEYQEKNYEKLLKDRLNRNKVKLNPMNYEEFIQSAYDYNQNKLRIFGLLTSFIQNAKTLNLRPDDIFKKLNQHNPKKNSFGQCGIYLLKLYNEFLVKNGMIDFADMIYMAIDIIKRNPEKYKNRYDQILVDEFQDISAERIALLQQFVTPDNNTKLFCVGDDWQSIYSFSGSNVDFFIHFNRYFDNPCTTYLNVNYRNPKSIVDAGNALLKFNKAKIKKRIVPTKNTTNPYLHILPDYDEFKYIRYLNNYVGNMVEDLVKNKNVQPNEIMVLCRFNRYFRDLPPILEKIKIPCENKVKKIKGVKLFSVHKSKGDEADYVILINVVSGTYGFPSELGDSALLEPVRLRTGNYLEEERRLFYVALTRTKEELHILTKENNQSMFLKEIQRYVKPIKAPRVIEFKL